MTQDYQFAVRDGNGKNLSWSASCSDLEEAKRQAQEFADAKGLEVFVYNVRRFAEVATVISSRRKRLGKAA
jgi:hypothetical protein